MKTLKLIFILLVFFSFGKITAQDISEQVEKNNQFSFELFKYIGDEKENLFLSPFSVSTALAMTYEGAKGKTREEIANILHFPLENQLMNEQFSEIIKHTQSSKNSEKYTFTIANSLWAQNDYEFTDTYFKTVNEYYNSPIEHINFKDGNAREVARKKINAWVMKKTNDKIKNLLDLSSLDADTKLVLINAVYFLAEWSKSFDEKATKEDVFYSQDGTVNKNFMQTVSRMKYVELKSLQILEIPYADNKASMIVMLPENINRLNDLKSSLTNDYFKSLYEKADYKNVQLSFPKFKIEYRNDLAKTLSDAGMKQAFSNHADFSGMVHEKDLKIDKIIHQTFINVDESGTEAAAATAVIMKRVTSVNPNERVVFKADRPFIFIIKENTTGSILFVGQLLR